MTLLDVLAEEVMMCAPGSGTTTMRPYPHEDRNTKRCPQSPLAPRSTTSALHAQGLAASNISVRDRPIDTLYADSRSGRGFMASAPVPMISGQPLRIKYLARAIAHMKEHQGV